MTTISTSDLQGLKSDIDTIDEVVESAQSTTTSKLGTKIRTLSGLAESIGYDVSLGVFAVGKTIEYINQVLSYDGGLYRPDENLPYTTDGATPDADSGTWLVVSDGVLSGIARALNAQDSDVMYSTDTTTVLDDVLYIYDASAQTTWGVPALDSTGKTIVSVVGSTLTTTGGTGGDSYALKTLTAGNIIQTVADMKISTTLRVGDVVTTSGYATMGDGGTNTYEVVAAGTGVDDGGSYIDLAGSGLQAKGVFPGDFVTAVQFGAKIDGVTDDSDKFESCDLFCDTNGLTPHVPAGEAFFTRSITLKALWQGAGMSRTKLVFDQSGGTIDGIKFDAVGAGAAYGLKSATIVCKGGNGGTALETSKGEYFTLRPKCIVKDVELHDHAGPDELVVGFLTVYAWTVGFNFGDVQGLDADNLYYYGNYDVTIADAGQLQSTAVILNSTQTLLFPRIGALWANAPRIGVDIQAQSFFFIDSLDITFSWIGFQALGINNYSEVFVNRLAINAQKVGVNVENIVRFNLKQGFVNSRAEGLDHGTEWVGYSFDSITKGFVGSIHAQPNQKYGGTVGFRATDCGGIYFNELTPAANIDIGLEVDNCAGYQASVMWQSVESGGVPYNVTNSARNGVVDVIIGSTSWSGVLYALDGTIDARNHIIRVVGATRQSIANEFSVMDRFDIEDKDLLATADSAWRFLNDSGEFRLAMYDAVGDTTTNALLINRTGAVVDSVDVRTDTIILDNGPTYSVGTGSPEGTITATVGSLYCDKSGGASTTLYVKESGTGNTGWVAK